MILILELALLLLSLCRAIYLPFSQKISRARAPRITAGSQVNNYVNHFSSKLEYISPLLVMLLCALIRKIVNFSFHQAGLDMDMGSDLDNFLKLLAFSDIK